MSAMVVFEGRQMSGGGKCPGTAIPPFHQPMHTLFPSVFSTHRSLTDHDSTPVRSVCHEDTTADGRTDALVIHTDRR